MPACARGRGARRALCRVHACACVRAAAHAPVPGLAQPAQQLVQEHLSCVRRRPAEHACVCMCVPVDGAQARACYGLGA